VAKVTHHSSESEAIRQRMEEVRCNLDEGVQDIVEKARDLRDWRSYVKRYPWVCVGVALTAGYLVVRRLPVAKPPSSLTQAEMANQSSLPPTSSSTVCGTVRGRLLSFAGDLVIREVSSFVAKQVSQFMAAHSENSSQEGQS